MALRADRISTLTDPAFLSTIVGDVASVEERPMGMPGFSGSTHARYLVTPRDGDAVSLVLKRTDLDRDWTAQRSGDRVGRETRFLAAPELARVWAIFASPYVAYAMEDGVIGLLMDDVAPFLLPDVREPIEVAQEEAIVDRLASLHAAYWELDLPDWLARPSQLMGVIGPALLAEGASPPSLGARLGEGWAEAFRRLPSRVADLLRVPVEEHARTFDHLPRTLLHGDSKVANFAFVPGGRLAAFDWALAARGQVAIEAGWYLAVNASRLTCSKEEWMRRYRERLEHRLRRAIVAAEWRDQERLAVLAGALCLLWSKALAVRDDRPGAREEWNWWVERLAYSPY